jgi:hypothetical protein
LKETLYVKLENNHCFQYPVKTTVFTPEISKMKYRNRIPEPVTTISGFADSKKEEKMNTDPRFFDM